MPFTAILASAVLSISVPSFADRLTFQDYPNWAVSNNVSASAEIEMVIGPDGRGLRCKAMNVVGDTKLASQICAIAQAKRFSPPKASNGSPSYAVVHELARFWIPGTQQGDEAARQKQQPLLEIEVNRLPNDAAFADVKIAFQLDHAGAVVACTAGQRERQLELVNAICAAPSLLAQQPLLDKNGQAVGFVTERLVRAVAKQKV